jgi:antitoxin MazE
VTPEAFEIAISRVIRKDDFRPPATEPPWHIPHGRVPANQIERDNPANMIYNIEVYPAEVRHMQVSKWGNSLAVRLPAAVVEALGLREGDEIAIDVAGPRNFHVARDGRRDEALETLRTLGWSLPSDYAFSRDEANQRDA